MEKKENFERTSMLFSNVLHVVHVHVVLQKYVINLSYPQISMNVRLLKQTIVTPTLFVITLRDLTSVDVSKDMREMA